MDFMAVLQKLTDDIDMLINAKLKKIPRDVTFRAKIIKKVSDRKYQITYKGKSYNVNCEASLASGDFAYVTAPKNNWSELFINIPCTRSEFNKLNSDLTTTKSDVKLKSIGNATSATGWTVTASNAAMANGVGLVYGTIRHNVATAPAWGEVIGTFPGFSAYYNVPLLIYSANGRICVTAVVDIAGQIKLYNPDYAQLTTAGENFQFQAVYLCRTPR